MDGSAVFNFVQGDVPALIDELLDQAGIKMGTPDYFFFHQPNRFMLQKLADKMKVPYEKMPSNVVEHFGNSSGVTIPVAITFNLRERLKTERFKICLAGYGVGLAWGGMLLDMGMVKFNSLIDF
jgi:3-oxoacyl-[acyl-carrier-protein] synthase-3